MRKARRHGCTCPSPGPGEGQAPALRRGPFLPGRVQGRAAASCPVWVTLGPTAGPRLGIHWRGRLPKADARRFSSNDVLEWGTRWRLDTVSSVPRPTLFLHTCPPAPATHCPRVQSRGFLTARGSPAGQGSQPAGRRRGGQPVPGGWRGCSLRPSRQRRRAGGSFEPGSGRHSPVARFWFRVCDSRPLGSCCPEGAQR